MKSTQKEFLENIENHKGMVFKVTKLYADGKEDREDLFQEIVFQLWKSYQTFEGKSQFSTWLYRVSINTAITFLKKEKKMTRVSFPQNNLLTEEVSPEKETQLDFFYKAVHELSSIEKALIFLFLEGHSHREIATNLGISEVNARVKLSRTKEKLQKIIKTYGYEF